MTSKSKSFTTETKLVRELAIIFDEKDLTELELETDDISIRLARGQKDQQILTMPQQAFGPHAQHSAPAVVSTPDAISETRPNTTTSDLSACHCDLRSLRKSRDRCCGRACVSGF